ncbi:MAG: TetR/AcrR family transcriptional regulator [Pseudomonadales bacterium]|nr:TetR/AcrR family transcriptional regulator [Pseudomonadales bacterium]
MRDNNSIPSNLIHARLLQAARDCFLSDEYQNVTTRLIAEKASTSAAMIHYYFGSKEGLYEEMIRDTMAPLLDQLDGQMFTSSDGFSHLLRLYYQTVSARPEFPKLILKVLALNKGPGKRFILQLIERGRTQGKRRVNELKSKGEIAPSVDPEVLRMAFVSLAMTPMLLKDIFEEQWGYTMDSVFLEALADFNGRMFTRGINPTAQE